MVSITNSKDWPQNGQEMASETCISRNLAQPVMQKKHSAGWEQILEGN